MAKQENKQHLFLGSWETFDLASWLKGRPALKERIINSGCAPESKNFHKKHSEVC